MRLNFSWLGLTVSFAFWIGLRTVLLHVSFWWTVGVLGLLVGAGVVAVVRRWRSRPLPLRAHEATDGEEELPPLDDDRVEIAWRRGVLVLQLLLLGGFGWGLVVVACWLLADLGIGSGTAEIGALACLALSGVFLPIFFGALRHLVVGDPGLIIDHDGMVIGTIYGTSRRVRWREVERVRPASSSTSFGVSQTYLAVDLSDPGAFLSRQHGVRGFTAKLAWRTERDPIRTSFGLRVTDTGELLDLIRRYSHGHVHTRASDRHHFAPRHRKQRPRFGRRDERRPHHHT